VELIQIIFVILKGEYELYVEGQEALHRAIRGQKKFHPSRMSHTNTPFSHGQETLNKIRRDTLDVSFNRESELKVFHSNQDSSSIVLFVHCVMAVGKNNVRG